MKFDFFTFGGGQFWEDVFFYQKWRIQRNHKTKKYRLLDNWDIRRHEGTFEQCRQAFVKFIEVHEISRQKGHMIIMLHGMGDTKNIFKPMWRKALEAGYMAASINYPSTKKDLAAVIRQLNFLLNNLEDVTEVSFITKGIGGVILRKLLSSSSPWIEQLKINRIVQISPPNKGSKLFGALSKWWIFRWFFGPLLKEMSPQGVAKIPVFDKKYEVGVIYTDYPLKKWAESLPLGIKNSLPSVDEAQIDGVKALIQVKNSKFNIINNPKTLAHTINFIKKGKF
ncbi:MAG: hypothetical protein LBL47_00170 [Lactobacillus sp.]|jgi:hypothetical protein|nr:hypothetical protein [Lactobacillus sp.]